MRDGRLLIPGQTCWRVERADQFACIIDAPEVIAMGRDGIEPSTVLVSLRTADDLDEVAKEWAAVGTDELALAEPWRTFRWYLGQRHYSGTYWSSTVGVPVIYESRLELARLLFADFEPSVRHIDARRSMSPDIRAGCPAHRTCAGARTWRTGNFIGG